MTAWAHRATVEEKAEAWDKVMAATGDESRGILGAWTHLRDLVWEREAMLEEAVTVPQERLSQLRVVGV